ncbi:MAG: phosphate acyltransferase PlsX [Clostridia bacterium]|nr:phosphate acyltransferase PlsX [Clostridia bacterium]
MTIILDAMGGDHAPEAVVAGCKAALEQLDVDLILVGREKQIRREMEICGLNSSRVRIVHAEEVVLGEDDPVDAIRRKKDSSMRIALSMLKNGDGDVVVSGGNTGALISGITLLVKRMKGVRRVALAPILPTVKGGVLLLDAGANVECTPAFLRQFAVMGSIYMETVMGISKPCVRLLNIGTEEEKGTPLIIKTHRLLKELPINYGNYIEARDIPLAGADVVVCDGFTGNVVLKSIEGMGSAINMMIKGLFLKNAVTKLAAGLVHGGLKTLKKSMDYTEYGGAPILGAAKPVIKAHGSSDGNAFFHAIRQAELVVRNRMTEIMAEKIKQYDTDESLMEKEEVLCTQK